MPLPQGCESKQFELISSLSLLHLNASLARHARASSRPAEMSVPAETATYAGSCRCDLTSAQHGRLTKIPFGSKQTEVDWATHISKRRAQISPRLRIGALAVGSHSLWAKSVGRYAQEWNDAEAP